MKIMLLLSVPTPEVKILLDELERAGHEIVYWVGEGPIAHLAPKTALYHDHYEAWDGKPAPSLAARTCAPPPAKLIEELYTTESFILPMMNKRYDLASVDERKQIYYDMLGYWHYVLETVRPDAVVMGSIPHSIYSYIIYALAQRKGVATFCCEATWVACRQLWYRDIWIGNEDMRTNLVRYRPGSVSIKDLGEELQEYWRDHTGEKARVEPIYMTDYRRKGTGWILAFRRAAIAWKGLFSGYFFILAWKYIHRRLGPNLKKEYECVVQSVDFSKPFVYFPLHFQPECTTTPQGGVYHQQVLVAQTLAAALPKGWELFIKEHPLQWMLRSMEAFSSVRYRGYYEQLARIPNVRIVPVETNTYVLADHARAIAVITGTPGWEGLLRGKCPLVFGIPWYRNCPGIFRVDSVQSCARALEAIEGGARVSQQELLSFLKALEDSSIRAYLSDPMEKNPRYTPEENMRTIALHICKLLHSVPVK